MASERKERRRVGRVGSWESEALAGLWAFADRILRATAMKG